MKQLILSIIFLCAISFANAQTINDPNAEVRAAKNFHQVNVSNSFDVFITQATDEAVAVSAADTKNRDMIEVVVKDGILSIRLKKEGWRWKGNMKLKAYISVKNLDKLVVSGACDVFIQGTLKASNFKLDVSGASDMQGKIVADKMVVDLSGASDINLSGSATQLTVDVSGASKFKGIDLATDICDARASGASDISITVNKELSANTSGSSDVKYKGMGTIRDLKTSGSSRVTRI
jgi:hypothetical protein